MTAIGPILADRWPCGPRAAFLLDDACGIPGIYGPGRVVLGHVPFYRAVECCEHACADPSNCPPRTRDSFERAITLDLPPAHAAPTPAAAPIAPDRPAPPDADAPPACVKPSPRPGGVARLGDVLPVPTEKVVTRVRTVTRIVTPSLPGRFIDLIV